MNSGDEAAEHDERSRGKLSPERVLTLTDGNHYNEYEGTVLD